MSKPNSKPGCLGMLILGTGMVFIGGVVLGNPSAGLALAAVFLVLFGPPTIIAKCVLACGVKKAKTPQKSESVKVAEPKVPTVDEYVAQAERDLKAALGRIDRAVKDEEEREFLKQQAREAYLEKISPYLR
jgi:outer membrane murein-binding lipoprotein Lpp